MVTQDRTVFLKPMTLDINLQITWTTIEPGTTRVDALWCRMLMPFTSERWALVQKTCWLADRKLCLPAMQAAQGELAEGETGTPENQEGQAHQKGRHERRQDSIWAKCTYSVCAAGETTG
jgi:hypothetical protein